MPFSLFLSAAANNAAVSGQYTRQARRWHPLSCNVVLHRTLGRVVTPCSLQNTDWEEEKEMSKLSSTRRLGLESMESRQLMAGNIFASVSGGDLFLTGDSASNGVEIRQLAAGQYQLIGTTQGGAQTTIWLNGVAANSHVVNGVTDDFEISLNGGNDYLYTNATGLPAGAKLQVPDDMNVRGGDGNDAMYIYSTQVRDDLYVDQGSGDDYLSMYNSWVYGAASSDNDMSVFGSTGNDVASIYNSYVRDDLFMSMSLGNDAVYLGNSTIVDDASIYTSDGDDRVSLYNTYIGDNLVTDTGAGKDSTYLNSVRADEIYSYMGSGSGDYLNVANTRARVARFDGGSGWWDNIDFGSGNSFGSASVTNFEL